MKFDITVDGGHKAEIDITQDGNGGFSGTVTSPDYGTGAITNGVQTDSNLKGNVTLDGYDADFAATLAGATISGKLSYGWFFNKNFTGTQIT
jgi:hypothetical protein